MATYKEEPCEKIGELEERTGAAFGAVFQGADGTRCAEMVETLETDEESEC